MSVALAHATRPLAVRHRRPLLGMERYPAALRVRREHDGGLGAGHPVERADLGDQALQRRRVRGLHLEEERVLPGDVMALEHAVERGEPALEAADLVGMARDDPDERGDVEPEQPRFQGGVIPLDDPCGFELLDALHHRRRAQPDVLADAGERRPAVVLEHVEDAAVGVVELGFLLVTEYHKAPQGYWWPFIRGKALLSMVR